MKISPLADRIVIEPDVQEEKKGSLFIPESAKSRPTFGKVIEVGPGRYEGSLFIMPQVKIGDKVVYGKYSGIEIEIDDTQCLVMRESDIIGIIRD